MSLATAQDERRARGDELVARSVSEVVDLLADEVNLSNADRVGPATREKLKGPLKKYARSAHPWQDCVNDLTPKKGSVAAVGICVVPETPVDTDRGQVCMGDLRTDDLVWSFNQRESIFELKPVVWAGRTRRSAEVVRVEVDGESLLVTPDHLFLTIAGEWVEAQHLRSGSLLLGPESLGVLSHAREAVARPVVLAMAGVLGPEVATTANRIGFTRASTQLDNLVGRDDLGDLLLTAVAHQRLEDAHRSDGHVAVHAPLVAPLACFEETLHDADVEDVHQMIERLSIVLRGDDARVAAGAGFVRVADVPAERSFSFEKTSGPPEIRGRQVSAVSVVPELRDVWDIEVADNYSFVCHSKTVLHNCSVLKDIIRGTTMWRGKNNPRDVGTPGVVGLSDTCVAESMLLDDEVIEALTYFSEVDVADLVEDNFALTAAARKALPSTSFAMPKTRQYPIQDRMHAGLALGRAKGKPEYAVVKAAVCKRYSTLPACQEGGS